jgi:PIN domain nuclease of toxin-antitoxin system
LLVVEAVLGVLFTQQAKQFLLESITQSLLVAVELAEVAEHLDTMDLEHPLAH